MLEPLSERLLLDEPLLLHGAGAGLDYEKVINPTRIKKPGKVKVNGLEQRYISPRLKAL